MHEPAPLLGELPSRLDELLEPDESESLELEPELSDDDFEDLRRPLTRANAAASAILLRVRPNWSSLTGAGGLVAPARIIPGDGARFRGAGGFIRAARSLAALRSETMTEGDT